MALISHDYYCPKIGMASELRILLPDACLHGAEQPRGVLFLLPQQGESGQRLVYETGLGALAEQYRIAAVIPPCLEGCFTDMVYGYPFYQSLKYVRDYLKTYFPGLPFNKGKCAIAGIGISAMAAIRWAAEEPDFFRCAGSIAGLLDPSMEPQGYFTEKRLTDLFGEREERIKKKNAFLETCTKFIANGGREKLYIPDKSENLKPLGEQIGAFVKHVWGGEA